ncbi:hypothetical protein TYRP_002640 [Tyrophagus putrescentiae]|nr:hypothetical protein TYRP_002640 [Tyrophagus putrescentiae]
MASGGDGGGSAVHLLQSTHHSGHVSYARASAEKHLMKEKKEKKKNEQAMGRHILQKRNWCSVSSH